MARQCQPLFDARDLSVNRGRVAVLNDVSLQLSAGETVGLLGLNGAGKSTLLQVLAGSLQPQRGKLYINSQPVAELPFRGKQLVGYAPHIAPLYPDFTVRQMLQFAARLRRVPRSSVRQRVSEAIERCDLTDYTKRIIGNLSHGIQQRINIAQAIVHKPAVVLLDEPMNGLDPAQMQRLQSLLAETNKEHAVLYSSHQLADVASCCNRAIVLHKGAVVHHCKLNSTATASVENLPHDDPAEPTLNPTQPASTGYGGLQAIFAGLGAEPAATGSSS